MDNQNNVTDQKDLQQLNSNIDNNLVNKERLSDDINTRDNDNENNISNDVKNSIENIDDESSVLSKAMNDASIFNTQKNKKQVLDRGVNWYVVQTYTGYEEAVKKSLLQRIETYNMQDQIFEVMVPKETVIDYSKTKPEESKEIKKRIFPGYVFVKMKVSDASWYVVRNTPHVTGFLGAGTVPVPVDPVEYQRIKSKMGVVDTKVKVNFKVGDMVIIKEGPFAKFTGEVKSIDNEKRKIRVLVNVFGRETPLEMDLYQVSPIV